MCIATRVPSFRVVSSAVTSQFAPHRAQVPPPLPARWTVKLSKSVTLERKNNNRKRVIRKEGVFFLVSATLSAYSAPLRVRACGLRETQSQTKSPSSPRASQEESEAAPEWEKTGERVLEAKRVPSRSERDIQQHSNPIGKTFNHHNYRKRLCRLGLRPLLAKGAAASCP